ncbi:hypothetical protein BKA66DRAFT_473531 [Pyrenochaeta sp. MPI-SDFR-AT-0127]|nr:hypothetical protein BKA66DRAFT_473531 [Pyrenochaeta sp. MPI-SDFR-AT-0127]
MKIGAILAAAASLFVVVNAVSKPPTDASPSPLVEATVEATAPAVDITIQGDEALVEADPVMAITAPPPSGMCSECTFAMSRCMEKCGKDAACKIGCECQLFSDRRGLCRAKGV